jgi:NhaP-type Na+/H+ or K+/H+ antiporter
VAVAIALTGTRVSRAALAFMSWFGPTGVATRTFSLLVLASAVPDAERIFYLAALVVLCSIVVHGLTDTPGSEWMARRAEAEAEDREGGHLPGGPAAAAAGRSAG